jgi:hypothetical protein
MQTEIEALEQNQTWILVDLPHNKKAIGCKWVYHETFSPVAKLIVAFFFQLLLLKAVTYNS